MSKSGHTILPFQDMFPFFFTSLVVVASLLVLKSCQAIETLPTASDLEIIEDDNRVVIAEQCIPHLFWYEQDPSGNRTLWHGPGFWIANLIRRLEKKYSPRVKLWHAYKRLCLVLVLSHISKNSQFTK